MSARAFVRICLAAAACSSSLRADISIEAPSFIAFPPSEVLAEPQTLQSLGETLVLSNPDSAAGWTLVCEIVEDRVEGQSSGASIPAVARFASIRWISGGAGSTAGISIAPDGSRVEAAPGFGEGVYEIGFDVRLDAPPFLSADTYSGVVSLSIQ